MIENIPKSGSIITYYQPFEKGVIKDLSEFCPNMKEELLGINERIIDLMIPFAKGGYYHPEFEGSFSIKKVLPALCKNNDELDFISTNKSVYGYLAISGKINLKYQWSSCSINTKANMSLFYQDYGYGKVLLPNSFAYFSR